MPADKQFLASCVFYLQIALIAGLFLSESICESLKVPVPAPVIAAKQNMMMSFMGIWLVGNMLQSSLVNTGAFEIHHGDQLIWSSLEEKRLPNMKDLIEAFGKTGVEFMTGAI